MHIFADLASVERSVNRPIGPGDWLVVSQEMIDEFADVTGDHQWIHVDPERAARGPFGSTIAHGYLTLSLLPRLANGLYAIDGVKARINYGANKIRFPAPVPVGSRIRATVQILSVEPSPGRSLVTQRVTVALEGSAKPACVAETIAMIPD